MRHRSQKGDEEPDLRASVESLVARERPRNAVQVEGAQKLIGVPIGANKDSDLVEAPAALLDPFADQTGHLVGLLGGRLVVPMLRGGPGRLPDRGEVLLDSVFNLQAVRIVMDDETIGRVEDALVRPIVGDEHDPPGLRIALQESADVRDGRSSPAIDGLVVVGDHRDVAVARGQEFHQLELGVICVLELIDQDVLEAPLVGRPHVRPGAEKLERIGNLIAEVDHTLRGHQLLIACVGVPQLLLLGERAPGARRPGIAGWRRPFSPRAPRIPPVRCPRPYSG